MTYAQVCAAAPSYANEGWWEPLPPSPRAQPVLPSERKNEETHEQTYFRILGDFGCAAQGASRPE